MSSINPVDGSYYITGGDSIQPTHPLWQVKNSTPTYVINTVIGDNLL